MAFSVSYNIEVFDKFSKITSQFNDSIDSIRGKVGTFNTSVSSLGTNFKKFGDKIKSQGQTLAFSVTAPLVAAVTAYSKFEDGLENVLTLLSKDEINKFKGNLDAAQTSAVKLGFSVEDASKALFDTVSALGMNSQAMNTFKESQKLAIGGVTSLSIASDGLTSVVNAYGKETTNVTDVANAFFTAQKFGKTTVEALAQNVGKVAPIARQAGVGFKELLAAMSQLTLGGLSTEEATTSLKNSIQTLLKPGKESIQIFNALDKKFGIKIPFGAVALKSKGLGYALQQLSLAAEKAPNALARMIPNIRALTGIGSLGTKQLENMDNIIKSINENIANGTGLNDAYALKMAGIGQQSIMLWGDIKVLSKELVTQLAPAIERILEAARYLIQYFLGLSTTTKKLIASIVGLVAVLGPLMIIIGSVIKIISIFLPVLKFAGSSILFLSKAFVFLNAAIAAIPAILSAISSAFITIQLSLGLILGLLGLPLWAFVGIIAGVVTGVILLVKYWDSFISGIKTAFAWVEKLYNRLKVFMGFEKGGALNIVQRSIIEKQAETQNWQRGPIAEKTREKLTKNLLEGSLNINIRDKGGNVQSVTSSSSGPLNLGIYGLAQ